MNGHTLLQGLYHRLSEKVNIPVFTTPPEETDYPYLLINVPAFQRYEGHTQFSATFTLFTLKGQEPQRLDLAATMTDSLEPPRGFVHDHQTFCLKAAHTEQPPMPTGIHAIAYHYQGRITPLMNASTM
ncbi:hypothetical protein EIL50_00540 [bacterium NHP-B]|nr:hypothetical protein EIL50_00540 [bacterium NHP-B]